MTYHYLINFKLESGRNSDVVTGIKYNPDNLEFPTNQFCYIELKGGKKRIIFNIANKNKRQNKTNLFYDINSMKDSISRKDFIESQKLCKFRN